MTTTEHTLGPWQQSWQFIVAPDPKGIHPDIYIAEIAEEDTEGPVASPAQQEANGRSIVAAPALFAACSMVIDRWEHGDLAEAARACHSAVALATDARPPWDITDDRPAGCRPYSVLLLYPDYANDSGTETYYAFVETKDPTKAVALAQRKAATSREGVEMKPYHFAPLLVTQGHHASEPLFNK